MTEPLRYWRNSCWRKSKKRRLPLTKRKLMDKDYKYIPIGPDDVAEVRDLYQEMCELRNGLVALATYLAHVQASLITVLKALEGGE